MSAPAEGLITLELQAGDPIQGTLRDQQGDRHVFRGWLELCAAIDQAWPVSRTEVEASREETTR